MDTILSKHPEIERFDEDRVNISPIAREYVQAFDKNNAEISVQLKLFREWFSEIQTFSHEKLKELEHLGKFTYSKDQRALLENQLKNIASNYPVPEVLKDKVKPGEYLDLRNEEDIEKYQEKLRQFAKLVTSKPLP